LEQFTRPVFGFEAKRGDVFDVRECHGRDSRMRRSLSVSDSIWGLGDFWWAFIRH
jgi:hypothetical protein